MKRDSERRWKEEFFAFLEKEPKVSASSLNVQSIEKSSFTSALPLLHMAVLRHTAGLSVGLSGEPLTSASSGVCHVGDHPGN